MQCGQVGEKTITSRGLSAVTLKASLNSRPSTETGETCCFSPGCIQFPCSSNGNKKINNLIRSQDTE